ncbi:MAG: AsmA family protein [Nitrospiraceae bacterium]|nr:AsmA family protein [Nitrospiraceae bacterium]
MKGCLKIVVAAVGMVLILAAIATLLLITQTDTYANDALCRLISDAAKTEVTLDRVRLLPQQQAIELHGLTVMNPPPLKPEPAIEIGRLYIQFDLKTLLSKTPRIRRIEVDEAVVHLHYRAAKGTNIGLLATRAQQAANAQPAPGSQAQDEKRTFTIDEFTCKGASVSLSTNLLPASEVDLNIAPFTLTGDVANRDITPAELTAIFLRTLVRETVTLKGLLKPAASLIGQELKSLIGQD